MRWVSPAGRPSAWFSCPVARSSNKLRRKSASPTPRLSAPRTSWARSFATDPAAQPASGGAQLLGTYNNEGPTWREVGPSLCLYCTRSRNHAGPPSQAVHAVAVSDLHEDVEQRRRPNEQCGGPDVCPHQAGSDHGDRTSALNKGAGHRIVEVGAAGSGAGGGNCAVLELHHLSDARAIAWVLDPDPPQCSRPITCLTGRGANDDVTSCIEAVAGSRKVGQLDRGTVRRPSLDQASRIEAQHTVIARQLVGEGTPGQLTRLVAHRDDLGDQRVGLAGVELPPADPADLAVLLVGAEQPIRVDHDVKGRLNATGNDRRVDIPSPDVDADRHPHDLPDPRAPAHTTATDGEPYEPPSGVRGMTGLSGWARWLRPGPVPVLLPTAPSGHWDEPRTRSGDVPASSRRSPTAWLRPARSPQRSAGTRSPARPTVEPPLSNPPAGASCARR